MDQCFSIFAVFKGGLGAPDGWDYQVESAPYKGCGHGFAVRADKKKVIENEGAEKAAEQAVEWFKSFL